MANGLFNTIVSSLQSCYATGEARAIARYVLEICFGLTQTDICMGKDKQIPSEEHGKLENIVNRLLQKEPVQYVLSQADFCGREFHVTPDVLIPRPETEELIQWIFAGHPANSPLRILDIGTGSGCIAITLSKGYPQAQVYALDISAKALDVARENASRHQARISFLKYDILQENDMNESFQDLDIIVSNPPYICAKERTEMEDNVLLYEPQQALFVPDDQPLLFYRAIGKFAQKKLVPDGWLYVEINRKYSNETMSLFQQIGFHDIELKKDLCGNDRMIRCKK